MKPKPTKQFRMEFKVGQRDYILLYDAVQNLITDQWKPAAPLRPEWLPEDQWRQLIAARTKFRHMLAAIYDIDPNVRHCEYKQRRLHEV
jgi:hypothetical protein